MRSVLPFVAPSRWPSRLKGEGYSSPTTPSRRGSARRDGTGLGLATARELARAHGGDVELVSTGPGGTVFAVILPVAE